MATICNCGKIGVAKRIADIDSAPAYTYMSVGGGTTTEAATQTGLTTEMSANGWDRVVATCTYEADYKTKWEGEFTNGIGFNVGLNELGIHNGSTPTAGDILLRHVFASTIPVEDGGTAVFAVTITLAS
jgi:hypothetical protein